MKDREIDQMLEQTLIDQRLSGSERQALSSALNVLDLNDAERAFIRHRAFALARARLNSPNDARMLDWLEETVKMLHAPATNSPMLASDVRFSPHQDCVGFIASMIRKAKLSLDVCVFTITDDRIAAPLLDAHARGVAVRIVTDDEKSHELGSDVQRLSDAGVPLRMDRSPYHMHHKFAIFDRAALLTGSYNWTRGAAINNKENVVFTTDPRLVRSFSDTFETLWTEFV